MSYSGIPNPQAALRDGVVGTSSSHAMCNVTIISMPYMRLSCPFLCSLDNSTGQVISKVKSKEVSIVAEKFGVTSNVNE